MEAIEFNTVLHNGTIRMLNVYPPQWEGKAVRVILLAAPDDQTPLVPLRGILSSEF
ncbi:MAG: hypothetical protein HC910_12400 [Spirulinaceae cyanobacterium SM2_1_0]|nr:hypothetical protein [Spirulinaceae cyanobacterium SM2_1_0]